VRQKERVQRADRAMMGVAAAFVAVAGLVWCLLSVLLAVATIGVGPMLGAEVVRVGGPPAVVAIVAGVVSFVVRRRDGP